MKPNSPAERRKQLLRTGYMPLPITGKIPPLQNWNAKTETNDGEIDIWSKLFPNALSTGLLTQRLPALDLDILDEQAAEAAEALARERFEERGPILVRIGRAPKRAVLFRTNDPFKKISVSLTAPNGDEGQKIELLADGQQLVAFGLHQDTGKPYRWFGGEPGDIQRDDLPYIHEAEARQLVDDIAGLLCRDFGYQRAKSRPKNKSQTNGGNDAGTGSADWGYLVENTRAGRDLHDSLRDLSGKLVRSGMNAGAVVNFLYGLMDETPEGERDQRWKDRRAEIPRLVDGAAEFKEHGDGEQRKANRDHTEIIRATPFVWIDPASIPPRNFLYGRHLVRQFVSTTISHGGGGKSALEIAEALAMTSNQSLLGIQPSEPLRVWYWNGEDPRAEIDRRVMATALHYGLTADNIGRLYVDTGREMPIIIAEQTRDGAKILVPVVDAVIQTIQDQHIDAAIIDPFVSSHRVTENDNNAIELVVKKWAHIADVTDCAIELVHHSRKTGADVTVQDTRGAIALLAAARSARVLNVMSEDEASQAGVENRKWYFRADNGKANLAPPVDKAAWFRFVSVALGNGDDVGVPTAWQFPNAFDNITAEHLLATQRAVAAGGPWRENPQAKDWVGKPIAKALKLNPDKKADRKKIATLLKTWIANGAFREVAIQDPKRRDLRTFIEVGEWANN